MTELPNVLAVLNSYNYFCKTIYTTGQIIFHCDSCILHWCSCSFIADANLLFQIQV